MSNKLRYFMPFIFISLALTITLALSSCETETESKVLALSPHWTKQPSTICLKKNESGAFDCKAELGVFPIYYRWYEIDQNGQTRKPLGTGWSTESTLQIEGFSEKGIRYFICEAMPIIPEQTTPVLNIAHSNLVAAAYTDIPILYIDTVNSEEPTAEYVTAKDNGGNYGATLRNHTKPPARMRLVKTDGGQELYDSGEDVKGESGLTIKLRGNTSAWGKKKPYKIKLQKKADLLASLLERDNKDFKSKDWILLTEKPKHAVGFAVADIAGVPWTPKYAYVNLVMNGEFRGLYMLIESISQGKKRVNVADDGYIIERDAYWWNEEVKFFTDLNQKFTFKYPDDEDITQAQIDYIRGYMNSVEEHIQDGTYESFIDTEAFARWQLIHDILGTRDGGGSNIYISKYDSADSKITMSTPWDFDSIYGIENDWSSVHNKNRIYTQLLLNNQNTVYKDSYKSQWAALSDALCSQLSAKLSDWQTHFGEDINLSRKCDAVKRGANSSSSVEEDISLADSWFSKRKVWLDSKISGL